MCILLAAFLKLAPSQRKLYGFSVQLDCMSETLCVVDDNLSHATPKGKNDDDHSVNECTKDTEDNLVVKLLKCESYMNNENKFASSKIVQLGQVFWWQSCSFLIRFVTNTLLEHLVGCESGWQHFDQLFEALHAFASCGCQEALYLVKVRHNSL